MNLSINAQQSSMVSGFGAFNKFGVAANVGKPNIASAQPSNAVRAAKLTTGETNKPAKITMDDMLNTVQDNLNRLRRTDADGKAKDTKPLLDAIEDMVNQLERHFGKPVADMAVGMINQSVAKGGAGEANLSAVFCGLFNKIASDKSLHEQNLKLSKEIYSSYANVGKDDWCADGLLAIWNAGSKCMPDDPSTGLAGALSDFFDSKEVASDQAYTMTTNKLFSYEYDKKSNSFGVSRATQHTLLENTANNGDKSQAPETSWVSEKFMRAMQPQWQGMTWQFSNLNAEWENNEIQKMAR